MKRFEAEQDQGPSPSEPRIFFAASLPALVLYWATLAPTVSSEDSGELITAAYTLGIAHPPGYPLWCLLGKLFTLVPLGTVAWRVNLLSAVLGAGAVGVLALIAFRFTRSLGASLTAALLYAASRDFWSQAVVAEVYTLTVFLFLLLLYCVLRFEDAWKTRWLYLAAFIAGLSLVSHTTFLPLVPVFFGWIFLRYRVLFRKPILLANLTGALLLGLSVVLYLPMRAATEPYMDWGHPESFSEFLSHFLRRQYTEAPHPRTVLGQAILVLDFLATSSAQFTPLVAALAPLGALACARRQRTAFLLLAVLFGLTSYGFIWLLNYPADRQSFHLTRVFFLPAHAIAAIWIALALRNLADGFARHYPSFPRRRTACFRLCGACLLALPVVAHFSVNNQSREYLAEDWGRNILQSLKPNAIIIPSADHSTFPLLYLQVTEGLRTDVLIANKYGYIDEAVFRELFLGRSPPRLPPPVSGTSAEKERYLIEHSARPAYFTTKTRIEDLPDWELESWGLVFEAVPKGTKRDEAAHKELWDSFRFREGSLTRAPGDFSFDLIVADYYYARGRRALLFSHVDEALAEFNRAARYAFGIKEVLNNLGGTLAEAGQPELALSYLKQALAIDSAYDLAIKNVASAHFALKRYREGLPWFERTLELEPESKLARLGKARGLKDCGLKDAAYEAYLAILGKDPWSEPLRKEIEAFAQGALGKDSPLARLPSPPPRPASRFAEGGAEHPRFEGLPADERPWQDARGQPQALLGEEANDGG